MTFTIRPLWSKTLVRNQPERMEYVNGPDCLEQISQISV